MFLPDLIEHCASVKEITLGSGTTDCQVLAANQTVQFWFACRLSSDFAYEF